ncbi:MAG: PD-(D/E)XK nuclease-like domain-containing protein [Actinobacteria bacterium]|nr:PD-(D/E)XK nuclease-like domain-containing protein [Actinomycetota bacterium]
MKTDSSDLDVVDEDEIVDAEILPLEITKPGLYQLSDEEYFADPVPGGSFSQSGSKILLQEGGPAKYAYSLTVGEEQKDAYDFGKAMHYRVLGQGTPYVVLDFENRMTKAYKEQAAEARAQGAVPILRKQAAQIDAMYEALMRHPQAREHFEREGIAELAGFVQDKETGVWLRGKFDFLTAIGSIDYKTSDDASPRTVFSAQAIRLGYHVQDAMYRRLQRELVDPECDRVIFAVQDKDAPYLAAVVELDEAYRALGERRLQKAIRLFAECKATESWPGYGDELITLHPPEWAMKELRNEESDEEHEARIAADMAEFRSLL